MNLDDIKAAADAIYASEAAREQIPAITVKHPNMTMDDAYAIQTRWVQRQLDEGRSIIGQKIGLTSKAMQKTMNISEPDYGSILDDMLFDDGSEIEADQFLDLRVEAELAFILKDRLEGPNTTMLDVLSATDYVIPAIELITARCVRTDPVTGYTRKVLDTISDNASCGGIVMGGRPVKPTDIDLRWVGALMYCNGVLEETGVAAGVLNHPANGVAWITRRFASQGRALEPGQIILAGAFTRPLVDKPGDTFHIHYCQLAGISSQFNQSASVK